jgi:hypothetical protein
MTRTDQADRAALLLAKKLKRRNQEREKREAKFEQEARECLNRILAKIATKGGQP